MPQVDTVAVAAIGFTVASAVGVSIGFFTALAIGAATIVAAGMLANKLISNLYEMPQMDTDQSRQNTVKKYGRASEDYLR
jgi:predicted MFS family arabinose efflux permease